MDFSTETIAAIATPPGRGGVGIVRVSGPLTVLIARSVLGYLPLPRVAMYGPFADGMKQAIDEGIAIFFQAPKSFTGEDVLELHGHGGPVVLDILLKAVLALGARMANPGEFSERAFLNDKIDLLQAEAIADLIDASSEQAARSAVISLQGAFSQEINTLVEDLIQLRMYVEASIDFPDEEIDFLSDGKVLGGLETIQSAVARVFQSASQGSLLREGMTVVLAGRPNAGKSSLLNALAGNDRAIVTEIEGTTRDVLKEHIQLDGLPLHIIDTAGLRESEDPIEKIGIQRAWKEIDQADLILMLVDSKTTSELDPSVIWPDFFHRIRQPEKITLIRNKIDLSGEPAGLQKTGKFDVCRLSVKSGEGIDELKNHLKSVVGYETSVEGRFMARRRHLEAMQAAQAHIGEAKNQLLAKQAGELVAEELKLAQRALEAITGSFSSDDLLGRIFTSFCIGK
jgi:tRNA modification GTPase